MALRSAYCKQVFYFNFQARTSRGAMRERSSWFVKLWDDTDPEIFGIGECAPLPGLSIDDLPDYEDKLREVLQTLSKGYEKIETLHWQKISQEISNQYPSIIFGIESAVLDLQHSGQRLLFQNDFQQGKALPINGLIWMADMDLMLQQIAIKIQDGYRCIKMKVGGLNFEKECDILHYVRKKYFRDDITIRLDANGAFKVDDCLYKLKELSKFNIHSIEQPIKQGQRELLREISEQSPIPIAIDEELIGVHSYEQKRALLQEVSVPYLILKPSLHGGLQSCMEWIGLAEDMKMGWWITSALESNVGLNAICQFTAQYPITIPQGLGTGQLYDNNIPSPLQVKEGLISRNPWQDWDLSSLNFKSV